MFMILLTDCEADEAVIESPVTQSVQLSANEATTHTVQTQSSSYSAETGRTLYSNIRIYR